MLFLCVRGVLDERKARRKGSSQRARRALRNWDFVKREASFVKRVRHAAWIPACAGMTSLISAFIRVHLRFQSRRSCLVTRDPGIGAFLRVLRVLCGLKSVVFDPSSVTRGSGDCRVASLLAMTISNPCKSCESVSEKLCGFLAWCSLRLRVSA